MTSLRRILARVATADELAWLALLPAAAMTGWLVGGINLPTLPGAAL